MAALVWSFRQRTFSKFAEVLTRTGQRRCTPLRFSSCPRISSTLSVSNSIPFPRSQSTMTTTMSPEPTAEEALALFEAVEKKFPHASIGDDKWYLVVLSALVAVEADHVGTLYTYLINKPQFSTSESRQALVRRLREALLENVSIQGICKPLQALFAIVDVEKPKDRDYSFSREHWKSGPENISRGEKWLHTLYKHNITGPESKMAAHKDFWFIEQEIIYGLYLSDMSILGPVDTQMVVLSGIMIQNLRPHTAWHLRGTRRVGVSMEDVELVQQCIELVASFGGTRLHKVPRVADIEHEV